MNIIENLNAFMDGASLNFHISDSIEKSNEAAELINELKQDACISNGFEKDMNALRGDWKAVGKDLYHAMEQFEQHGQ